MLFMPKLNFMDFINARGISVLQTHCPFKLVILLWHLWSLVTLHDLSVSYPSLSVSVSPINSFNSINSTAIEAQAKSSPNIIFKKS